MQLQCCRVHVGAQSDTRQQNSVRLRHPTHTILLTALKLYEERGGKAEGENKEKEFIKVE